MRASSSSRIVKTSSAEASSNEIDELSWVNPGSGEAKKKFTGDGGGQGYMGGLSYQLPQFVGVQYQPKDYTVELDRIINESLFKGMI